MRYYLALKADAGSVPCSTTIYPKGQIHFEFDPFF